MTQYIRINIIIGHQSTGHIFETRRKSPIWWSSRLFFLFSIHQFEILLLRVFIIVGALLAFLLNMGYSLVIPGHYLDFIDHLLAVEVSPDAILEVFLFLADLINRGVLILKILNKSRLELMQILIDFRLEDLELFFELILIFYYKFSKFCQKNNVSKIRI